MAFARDLSAAVRSLRKNPGFTCAVVSMLAVGIGATTAMFSVANGVLFAPLPYTNEKRLVAFVNHGTRAGDNVSLPDVLDFQHRLKTLDEVGAAYAGPTVLTGEGEPLRLGTARVSANWFSMLGIRAELGRAFERGEDGRGAAKIVIISDALWRTRFGGDRSVLGRRLTISDEPYTVVGVAAPQMALPYKLDAWMPMSIDSTDLLPARRGNRFFQAIGRVALGASIAQARAEVKSVAARLHEEYPVVETGLSFDLMPLREHIVGDSRPALLVLAAAVGCVLLIACANVASLLLLRARRRSAEMGIRLALGASPRRLIREMLSLSLVYGLAGGALGVALAEIAVRGIVTLRPGTLPLMDDVAVDWRVLLFAVCTTLATVVVFGMVPAIAASRTDLVAELTSGTRSTSAGKKSAALRQAFVVLELALSLVLLVGAGLLGRSFERLMSVDAGFNPAGLVKFDVLLPDERPYAPGKTRADSFPLTRSAAERFMRELRSMPGTKSVGAALGAPFTGAAQNQTWVHIEGDPPELIDRPNLTLWKSVTPGYFETLGMSLVRGRLFTERDRADAPRVLVVNEAFVKEFLRGVDPLGKVVRGGGEIVGIVRTAKNQSLTEAAVPAEYHAFDQLPTGYLTVVVRSSADPAAVIATARKRLATIDKTLPIFDAESYDELLRSTVSRTQYSWELVAGFSVFALLLAAAGIYGVVAFAVRQRRREFGIRIALGAQQRAIVRLVLVHAARMTALGVSIGLIVALAASSALRSMLYGVGATDFATYALGCAVLVVATLAASWLPAWSAGRVDPMVVMRVE
jgi:putative ABC transport system permease protein